MKKILIVIILIISMFFNSCFFNKNGIQPNAKNGIIATWINYYEISKIINSSGSYESLEEKILNIVADLNKHNFNTIFLHVRAFDDAFYNSQIFPKSKYCPDKDFEYDILKIFIDICHSENMSLHAWINPYRLSIDNFNENLFATELLDNYPEHLIKTDYILYYNPASTLVQNHIIDGIREIIEEYEVDGIHFDDYFYPQGSYTDYLYINTSITEKEFRTSAVNSLISAVYNTIKTYNEDLIFSISPSGDIEKNLNECYADVIFWCKNDGYIDYIIPQIYYGFEHKTLPFDETVMKWIDISNNKSKLIIGLAAYKTGEQDKYAGSGINEWKENPDVILKQINFLKEHGIFSYSIYSASYIYDE